MLPARLFFIPILVMAVVVSGCAVNQVHPEFEKRLAGKEKITGLLVKIEVTGLEKGGMKHMQLEADESVMFMAMRGMQQLFSEQQLQQMGDAPDLHLPEELVGFGYNEDEAERDTKLLEKLLKSALGDPEQVVSGERLESVKRLASRTGGDAVILGDIRIRRHISEESGSLADLFSILGALGGQYYVPAGANHATGRWAIIDPEDGSILRTFVDSFQYK
ncbi:MAG: hypothetical protein PVH46_03025 [Granulosicoccaceae bacterium]|jgi:hypothetical protein